MTALLDGFVRLDDLVEQVGGADGVLKAAGLEQPRQVRLGGAATLVSATTIAISLRRSAGRALPRQQFLYFLPLPHGQGALRPMAMALH